MFHSPSTIWHLSRNKVSFQRENRLVFKEAMSGIEKFDTTKAKVSTKVGGWLEKHMPRTAKSFNILWKLAYPIRLGMFPIRYVLGPTIDGISWGVDKAAMGGRYATNFGKEVGGGIKKVGGSIWEILKAPLLFAKKNIVDQTRSGIKGVFNIGSKVIQMPINFLSGLKESVSAARGGIKEVFQEAIGLHPINAVKAARKAIWTTLTAPISKPIGPVLGATKDMAVDMAENIGGSVVAYPKQMVKSYDAFKESVAQFAGAHTTAKGAMGAKPAPKENEGAEHGEHGENEGATKAKAKAEAEAKKAKAKAGAEAKKKAKAGHGGHSEAAAGHEAAGHEAAGHEAAGHEAAGHGGH